MGGDHSKTEAAPRFIDQPWRDIKWEDKSHTLQFVKTYKPQTEGQLLRILLHGPVGAGKSSFINSVQSILHGRMYVQALADNTSHGCFTKKYTTYKIPKGSPETFYPFVFNDTMGLDPINGVLVNDVKLAMMGHVMDGYTFNSKSTLSDVRGNDFYNEHPTGNDKVHVLVCVAPANTVSHLRRETVQKIREIRREASKLGIPQVAILTKIDEVCDEIKNDLKNVYKIKYLKEKMEQFSVDVGIPMNCIFPVKNYHEEIDLNSDVDSLILSALKCIIDFGDDCINFNKSIPQAAVLTKTDEACAAIKDNSKNVDKNKCPTEKMKEFSFYMDIPMNCIFPVKTYHEEIDLKSDVDSLILSALNQIIDFGEDYINFNKSIPQVAVLPKTDEACAAIKDDSKNVDKNKCPTEKMEEFSGDVDVPTASIFAVETYHGDSDSDSDRSMDRIFSFKQESV